MKSFITALKTISIILVILYGAILFMLSRTIGGYRAFVVQSGSMEPTIATGSLIVTQRTNPHALAEQDIVTFIRPDDTTEFVTHRIVSVEKQDDIPLFKTKGDNNESEDAWTLIGGGVVGKVRYAIPYLGYLIALSQSKTGIVLFIMIPALFIIIDEIRALSQLFSKKKPPPPDEMRTDPALPLLVIAFLLYSCMSIPRSQAVLTDSVSLVSNTITVSDEEPAITPTPSVHPCGTIPDIIIEGNGPGSTNTVDIDSNCANSTTQSNDATVTNTVSTTTNTGGGNSTTTVVITNSVNTNSSTSSAVITE